MKKKTLDSGLCQQPESLSGINNNKNLNSLQNRGMCDCKKPWIPLFFIYSGYVSNR